ncbi:putative 15-hydroxyprostaglandin dehydrogenase (NAD(+)) [Lupinus albus]|uniref:Putative 15-hydroxyprostaglandin dehydrogenase (NAD(+)) n=1 Tax=Lupinus albus TaxID=3870 RepID=A0A6A4PBW7_LUPAL|nr:putative 15-hydroxyprostaglandin dehydrogenase (NAD(+)) [Lupinus albus]
MEIRPGLSALVTGAASGIGKGLVLALAEKGIFVTVVDFSEDNGRDVAALVQKINAKFHPKLDFPSALFVKCDVTNSRDLAAAFEKHYLTYGGLDICINCAGIGNPIPFHKDQTDGTRSWKHTINVNFTAIIECTRLAIKTMEAAKRPGVIINMGSASGLYPMYEDPLYSGSKGGVVMFTRSLRPYQRKGIRINVLCPEFIETEMGLRVDSKFISLMGGFIPMEMLVKGAFELITDESKAGHCLWITNRRGLEYWPTPSEEAKYLTSSASRFKRRSEFNAPPFKIPDSYEKIVVQTLTHNFRNATTIVRAPLRLPVKPKHVLVKIIYAGVNASDVNFSSGRYFGGNNSDTASRLPFDAGFEAVGIIAAIGDSVTDLKVGMPCAFMTFGGYSEFIMINSKHALPVPRPDAEVVAMLTSGLTASIALEKAGAAKMESGKAVLVTAAAGGTGQFAVQLAKLAGSTVVATCGGGAKAKLLKELGVDRVIDYHSEDIKTVLMKEFPKGIDVIYESVGGDMLNLCLNALAVHGRLIVIGMISQYQGDSGWTPSKYPGLLEKLLAKSQTVAGFFLVQYGHFWQEHLDKLFNLYSTGKLKVSVDPKKFNGLHSVADAVEYLHSGKSVGKVVVCVDPSFHPQVAKL